MAPQRLEKIESAPGNGMGSEASNLQDLVRGRAADGARLWPTSPRVMKLRNSQAGGARRIAVGTALALTDYPWSLARLAAAEIADGAR